MIFFLTVIKQRFSPQVYDDFVVRGNTAVLRCHLPTFVKEYVSVDSWIRNDDYVLKMGDTRSKFVIQLKYLSISYTYIVIFIFILKTTAERARNVNIMLYR